MAEQDEVPVAAPVETPKEEEAPKAEEKTEEKTEAPAAEEPAAEEAKEAKEEEAPKEPPKPVEQETDAPEDGRPKLAAGSVAFNQQDSTLNFMPITGTNLCTSLSEGGMQYLLAGARANAGIKSGRYMFEARIVEAFDPVEGKGQKSGPTPRQLLRVGLTTEKTSLFLFTTDEGVGFDSEAGFISGRRRIPLKQKIRFGKSTVGILVNLDASSPNANTVSLFVDGKRASEPQAIPEALLGKPLFPTITYRNLTVDVNFGPVVRKALPFTCRMVGDAAKDDVAVTKVSKPKDGKYEVVFPVGMPEKGYFDFVDQFLAKNPGYTELSDRAIIQWATKSGFQIQRNSATNDKPSMNYGVSCMDDGSVRRILAAIAPSLKRNLVVAEVKKNLVPADREQSLAAYAAPHFKKHAVVFVGEPSADYVAHVHENMLNEKKQAAEKKKEAEAKEQQRKRLLEEKKKKAEEAKRARIAAMKKKQGKEDEVEEEPKAEEPEKEEEAEPPKADEPVALTEEEKAVKIRKTDRPDLSEQDLAKFYAKFSLPSKEEGFDAVSFAWQGEAEARAVLEKYVKGQKMTQKVQDLKPSAEFKEKLAAWSKQVADWKRKQQEWKDPTKKKALLQKKKEALKGEDGEEKPIPEIDVEELDVMGVADVTDIGNGMPLFADFVYEDWQLLTARYELSLLVHSFKKDLDDPDRPSFPEGHLSFYYNVYFKKLAVNEACGYKEVAKFCNLIKENVSVNESTGLLEVHMPEDTPLETYVKLVEDHRRDRQRRVDAGDESAFLKFQRNKPAQPASAPGAQGGGAGKPRPWSTPSAGGNRPIVPARPAGNYSGGYGGGGIKRPAPGGGAQAPAWKRPAPSGAGVVARPNYYGRR